MSATQPVVLVTGASSGIGHHCAALLARKGYRVYGAARGPIRAEGVVPLVMDVTNKSSVRQGFEVLLAREGRIDALINNAGVGLAGALENTSVEEARQLFEVNFFSVLRACRLVLPAMRRQGAGYIVNIGSIGGLIAIPYQGIYSASKFALEGLTESLRLEVSHCGIRVTLIEPGDHRTPFTQNRRFTVSSTSYSGPFERAIERMVADEQSGPKPESVAFLVHKVLNTRNPRLRYTTGTSSQRAAVWMKRLLPNWVTERVMRAHYRLDE